MIQGLPGTGDAHMNDSTVRFQCPGCRVRIKAPAQLRGQQKTCPGCKRPLLVPRALPEDVGPILVLLEGENQFSLGVRRAVGATAVRPRKLVVVRRIA
jgi:hypothetical protein